MIRRESLFAGRLRDELESVYEDLLWEDQHEAFLHRWALVGHQPPHRRKEHDRHDSQAECVVPVE